MKLLKLTLKNFKGIKAFTFEPDGKNMTIRGDNATGKTTIVDAISWLLFNKNSQNKKDFEIKTLTTKPEHHNGEIIPEGTPIHGLDHEVESVFLVDEKTITLKKTYHEKWTKPRGSAKKVFSGHTTEYWVDDVPEKKKAYIDRTSKLFDEETFKLLTNPSYFPETLHWTQRREILLKICGDIKTEDIISKNKSLAGLTEIIGERTIEDHKKVIASRKSKINESLKTIPARIDEVTQGMPDLSNVDIVVDCAEVKSIKKQIADKEKEIVRIEAGGEIAEKTAVMRELEGKIINLENELSKDRNKKVDVQRETVNSVHTTHLTFFKRLESVKNGIETTKTDICNINGLIDVLRAKWHLANDEIFTPPQNPEKCFACGHDIDESVRTEIAEEALSQFNLKKSESLEKINADGSGLKDALKDKNLELVPKEKELTNKQDAFDKSLKNLDSEKEKLHELEKATYPTKTPAHIKLEKERIDVAREISTLGNDKEPVIAEIKSQISTLDSALTQSEMKILDYNNSINGRERIKELESKERILSEELEKLEEELFMIEDFTRKKVEMLESKINSKFKLARFKMFKEQINGGLDEICEVTYKGVPYNSGLNNGARVNVGLDIIVTLSEFYGTSAPIFIDNAEAITEINSPENSQIIKLVVSEKDKDLRIETE